MLLREWALGLAGCSMLAQLVAIAAVIPLLFRSASRLLGLGLVGALSLMALRRGFAAAGLRGADTSYWSLAHDAAGLAVSGVVLALVLGLRTAWRRTPEPPPPAPLSPPAEPETATARGEERELLCYDLHDGLAPLVIGARMHLEAFRASREQSEDEAERELALAAERLQDAAAEVTRVVSYLALAAAPDTTLSDAVREYSAKRAEEHGWQCDLDDRLQGARFATATEALAYRVVQEALTNAARHAHTARVRVALHVDGGWLVAVVQDWGCGFDPERLSDCRGRLGLRGMCARARRAGGLCDITSRPAEGTLVTLRLPLPDGRQQSA